MIEDYPDFRFGWIYYCLEIGIHFYKTKGENAEELYRFKVFLTLNLNFLIHSLFLNAKIH